MKKIIIIFFINFIFAKYTFSGIASKNNKGNKLFEKEKYTEALKKYTDAQLNAPESPIIRYNVANTYYKLAEYDKALDEFNKALANTTDNSLKEKIYYNMGNTYFRMQDYVKAIENYKRALEIDPNDEDAKYNIEIARKRLQENLQPHSSKLNQNQNKTVKQKEETKNQNNQTAEQKDRQNEQKSNLSKDNKKISKEDAKRILDALEEEEKKTQKKLKRATGSGVYVEKDW